MLDALVFLITLAAGLPAAGSGRSVAPSYSAAGIANTASGEAGAIAPNTIATLRGSNLADVTQAVADSDMRNDTLPEALASVRIYIGNIPAHLYYVSPGEVTFLVPASLEPRAHSFRLVNRGINGPAITIPLLDVAPGLFYATHADGTSIGVEEPARPGETIVLYGSGLGPIQLSIPDGRLAPAPPAVEWQALTIKRLADLAVLLNWEPLESGRIGYAGLTPGTAGMYQINLDLPDTLPADLEIRVWIGDRISPGLILPARLE